MTTLYREQWEEPGYRIGEWSTSPPVDPADLLYTVNHYPAASVISSDPVTWFRAQQRAAVRTRGYSLWYSWGYWPDGTEFEVRGWDYRNAANSVPSEPGDENRWSVSFLLVVPGLGDQGQPATDAQIEAVRWRLVDVYDRTGHIMPNIVHSDLEPTGCAGAGVNRQTHAGMFQPIPPAPPTDPEEGDMILIRVDRGTEWAVFSETPGGVLRWIPNGREYEAWQQTGAPQATIPAGEFRTIVDYTRTAGGISDDVTRITGVTADKWAGRGVG